jgi:mono/diheme cytochrome c family protein
MRGLRGSTGIGVILLFGMIACSRAPVVSRPAAASPPNGSYELRLGKDLFRHYCQACHGETGAGDGFNAYNLDPRPRDLSEPAFQKRKSDADLADAVRRGGVGVGLSPVMPPWAHTLSPRQVDEVILYLRALRKHPAGPERSADGSSGRRLAPVER